MNKGFVFSFEAVLSILIFSLILLSLPQTTQSSFKELIVIQKINDLLKVWSYDFDISEIESDVGFIFKNNENVTVIIDEITYLKSKLKGESVSSQGIIVDKNFSERKINIIVYFN